MATKYTKYATKEQAMEACRKASGMAGVFELLRLPAKELAQQSRYNGRIRMIVNKLLMNQGVKLNNAKAVYQVTCDGEQVEYMVIRLENGKCVPAKAIYHDWGWHLEVF